MTEKIVTLTEDQLTAAFNMLSGAYEKAGHPLGVVQFVDSYFATEFGFEELSHSRATVKILDEEKFSMFLLRYS